MLVNPNIDLEKTLFDCLIIGAGPAGICAALKLANDKKKVLLIEGGDFEETDLSRSIYEGNIIGDPYPPLENLRARLFGGTLKQYSHCLRFFDETDKFIVDGDDFSLKTSLNKFHKESLEHFYTDDFQEDREIENSNFKFFRYIFSSRKNYTVKNFANNSSATTGAFDVFFILSTDTTYSAGDRILDDVYVEADLAAGASRNTSTTVTIPANITNDSCFTILFIGCFSPPLLCDEPRTSSP